jgi:hypothetical protein
MAKRPNPKLPQGLSGAREMSGSVLLKIGQEVTAVLGKKKIAPSFSFAD